MGVPVWDDLESKHLGGGGDFLLRRHTHLLRYNERSFMGIPQFLGAGYTTPSDLIRELWHGFPGTIAWTVDPEQWTTETRSGLPEAVITAADIINPWKHISMDFYQYPCS